MTDPRSFEKRVMHDAYAAIVTRMWADAWALGYEAARRDVERLAGPPPWTSGHRMHDVLAMLNERSYSDLSRRACREIADQRASAERELVLALATLGKGLDDGFR